MNKNSHFEIGHHYRLKSIRERPSYFNSEGMMDFILDGEWHKCIESNGFTSAEFKMSDEQKEFYISIDKDPRPRMWNWYYAMDDFECLEEVRIDNKQFLLAI